MPGFPFSVVEPNQIGQVTKWDVPFNTWLGLKFGNGHADTLGEALSRRTEDFIWDDNNLARPEVLNSAYGIPDRLKFDQPMSIQRARLMHERKRREIETASYLESASHSWFSAKAGAGLFAQLIGGLSHPLDLGLAFLPFIGSEKAAAEVSKLGGSAFKQALARGIFTEESLAGRLPFHRLSAAVIDGTVNQALIEIPVALQKHRDQADYTALDSAFNIIAGGAFAGGIKGIGLALERASKLWRGADVRIKEAALQDTVRTVLTGESPRTAELFNADEATVRAKVEEKIRAENPFEPPPEAIGSGEPVIQFRSPDSKVGDEFTDAGFTYKVESIQETTKNGETVREARAVRTDEGALMLPIMQQQKTKFEAALREAEASGDAKKAADAKVLLDEVNQRIGELEKVTADIRQDSGQKSFAALKAEHEAKIKGLVDAETQRVISEVKRQNPPMPKEDAAKYSMKNVPDDKNIAAMEEDTKAITEQYLANKPPEERAEVERQIKEEMAQVDAELKNADKAFDEMTPCIVKKTTVI